MSFSSPLTPPRPLSSPPLPISDDDDDDDDLCVEIDLILTATKKNGMKQKAYGSGSSTMASIQGKVIEIGDDTFKSLYGKLAESSTTDEYSPIRRTFKRRRTRVQAPPPSPVAAVATVAAAPQEWDSLPTLELLQDEPFPELPI